MKFKPNEVLATITPRPLRRGMAAGMMGVLGALLVYIAGTNPPQAIGYLIFLLVFGVGAIVLAWQLWQASSVTLELTSEELREEGPQGRTICRLDEIDRIDRSLFAFKPATGFLIHLKAPGTFVYAPGLWWRWGKRIAIGGVTSRGEAKSMAEIMNVLMVQRDHDAR